MTTRILVVDDEESLRFFLTKGLQKAGYAVDAAAAGREAIERLSKTSYDVVLTDIVMPDVSGLDVLGAVHEMDKDAVVVLMTAHGIGRKRDRRAASGRIRLSREAVRDEGTARARSIAASSVESVERENRKLRFLVEQARQLEHPPEKGGIAAARQATGSAGSSPTCSAGPAAT